MELVGTGSGTEGGGPPVQRCPRTTRNHDFSTQSWRDAMKAEYTLPARAAARVQPEGVAAQRRR